MTEIYPWQQAQWRELQRARQQQRLSHAILLVGQRGLGLDDFARALAHGLLCESPDETGHPCGQCQPCTLFVAQTHPDFRHVTILEDKTQIGVDQIRELQTFMQLSQAGEARKVAIISPAEKMHISAANSLLKTLEEPPGNALLILVTHQPARLPATIRSRCQQVHFSMPDKKTASEWLLRKGYQQADELLQLAGGAPCLAAKLSEDAGLQTWQTFIASLLAFMQGRQHTTQLAGQWLQIPAEMLLGWQLSLLRDLIRATSGVPTACFENQNQIQHLQKIAAGVNLERLFALYDQFVKLGRSVQAPLNPELLRERMALLWAEAFAE